jgi:hypothetical protein
MPCRALHLGRGGSNAMGNRQGLRASSGRRATGIKVSPWLTAGQVDEFAERTLAEEGLHYRARTLVGAPHSRELSATDFRSCWLACSRVCGRRVRRDRSWRSRRRGVTAEDPRVGRRARLGPKGSPADPQTDIQVRLDHPRRDCRGGRRDAMGGLPARDAGGMRTGTAPRSPGVRGFPPSPTRAAGRDAISLQLRHVRSGGAWRHRLAGGGDLQLPAGPHRPCSSPVQRANTPPRRRDHQEAPTTALPRRRTPSSLTEHPLDGLAAPLGHSCRDLSQATPRSHSP